jgi:rhamnulokinase
MAVITVGAIDLGAESGRVARVDFDGTALSIGVVHRFGHEVKNRAGRLWWDWPLLAKNVVDGVGMLGSEASPGSVGVDAWGLDYALLDEEGALAGGVISYRDPRRLEYFNKVVTQFGPEFFYEQSGTQVNSINGIFGFAADLDLRPGVIERARTLLMIPDLFHYLLSGARVAEYTAATTSGLFDIRGQVWSTRIGDALGVPSEILPEVVQPGTDLGPLLPIHRRSVGLSNTRVMTPPSHDTASAVLTISHPHQGEMFVSTGTWSLVGTVLPKPIVSQQSRVLNLTNEGGVDGTIRFLRNVMGLWILQESRRQWAREGSDFDYITLTQLATRAQPLRSIIDPADTLFLTPGDMPGRIRDYCKRHGQPVPESVGEMVRTIIDSLALAYRQTAVDLESITKTPIQSVRVVGGGIQNALLQQATADATGVPVRCGAVEATAVGNALGQLIALGAIGSTGEGWDVVHNSFPEKIYLPLATGIYDDAFGVFQDIQSVTSAERLVR